MIQQPFSAPDMGVGLLFASVSVVAFAWLLRRCSERRVLVFSLVAKLAAAYAYTAYVVFIYVGGDSLFYHEAGVRLARDARILLRGGSPPPFTFSGCFEVPTSSTALLCGMSGMAHLTAFDSLLGATVIFALIGYVAQLLFYVLFRNLFPSEHLRMWWRCGLLWLPSFVFWTSGLLKEPVRLLGLALTLTAVNRCLGNRQLRWVLLAGASFFLLIAVMPAAGTVTLPTVGLLMAIVEVKRLNANGWTRAQLRLVLTPFALLGFMCLIWLFWWRYQAAQYVGLEAAFAQSASYGASAAGGRLTTDSTLVGALKAWPAALVYVLLRPLPWEARGGAQILASLENLIILGLIVRSVVRIAARPRALLLAVRTTTFVPSLLFVAIYAFGIGIATPNLGTMSRYRVFLLPFLVCGIASVEYLTTEMRLEQHAAQTARERGVEAMAPKWRT